jgi:hypothetical protein
MGTPEPDAPHFAVHRQRDKRAERVRKDGIPADAHAPQVKHECQNQHRGAFVLSVSAGIPYLPNYFS